ncbi:MAG TPA: hypothetical protein VHU41_07045 [Thermoanaerobaculia bacterium]|jgi:hypothetical protein|nr:hypothetical protein [Thermoanaerobaculia bacterium]
MIVFDYLLTVERDLAVAAIYRAMLRLFEAKGGSRARAGVPEKLSCTLSRGNDVEKLSARIVFDIMDAEEQELSGLSREAISRYTALLAKVASSRYSAEKRVRSEAVRFLKEIDPETADEGLAIR